MLSGHDLSRSFGGVAAVTDVTCEFDDAEIVGPNGSGKTTLLNLLSGVIEADSGQVLLEGKDVTNWAPWQIGEAGLARTFQTPNLPERMTVIETMLCGARFEGASSMVAPFVRRRRYREIERLALEKCHKILEFLGLGSLAGSSAQALSGGQQKLLTVGIALMRDPKMLLLDEPTASMSQPMRRRLEGRLVDLRQDEGIPIILVEHDMGFVSRICDWVYVMNRGQVITRCRPDELAELESVHDAFLGAD